MVEKPCLVPSHVEAPAASIFGELVLCAEALTIQGLAGTWRLVPRAFRVIAQLLRRPGALVSEDELIQAMYPDADDEPDSSSSILRTRLQQVRAAVRDVTGGKVRIISERRTGWGIEEVGSWRRVEQ